MYHEEKIINGVLCWRGTPAGKFVPYTKKQLTNKIEKLNSELAKAQNTDLEELYNTSYCEFSIIECKLATITRNQIKIYNKLK